MHSDHWKRTRSEDGREERFGKVCVYVCVCVCMCAYVCVVVLRWLSLLAGAMSVR